MSSMSFSLSQTDGRPMYLQIMEQIKQRVAVNDWPPGYRLPSIRELSVAARVSVITVKRAYLELEREGLIVTQHGKGSWVADQVDAGRPRLERETQDHLKQAVRSAALAGLSDDEVRALLSDALAELARNKA